MGAHLYIGTIELETEEHDCAPEEDPQIDLSDDALVLAPSPAEEGVEAMRVLVRSRRTVELDASRLVTSYASVEPLSELKRARRTRPKAVSRRRRDHA